MTSTVDMWRPILKLILNLHVSQPELPTNPVTKASTYSSFYISIGNGNLCILSLTDVTSRTYDILILFFTCPPNSMGSCHYHPDDYHMFRSCPFFVPRPPAARPVLTPYSECICRLLPHSIESPRRHLYMWRRAIK